MSASGSEFSVGAELSLSIANGQLSSLRSQIENELSDIPVGVDASGVGGGSRMQPRDPATGQFMSIEGVEQRVIEQTEAQVELLDDIKDAVEGGGIGLQGDGGGTTVLSTGLTGAAGGAAAGAGALGGAAALLGAADFAGREGVRQAGQQFPEEFQRLLSTQGGREFATSPFGSMLARGGPTGVATLGGQIGGELLAQETIDLLENPPDIGLPEGIPPELQLPQGFPPELDLPTTDWPPELQVPQAPRWARDLIDIFGGPSGASIDVSADVSRTIDANVDFLPNPQEIIDDVLGEVEPQVEDAQQEIDNLRNELERALGL